MAYRNIYSAIIFFVALFFAGEIGAQTTLQANRVIAKDSIRIAGRWIKLVSTDSTFSAADHTSLPTTKAVYDFVTASAIDTIYVLVGAGADPDTICITGPLCAVLPPGISASEVADIVSDSLDWVRDSIDALQTDLEAVKDSLDNIPSGSGTDGRFAGWGNSNTLEDYPLLFDGTSVVTLDAGMGYRIPGGTTVSRPTGAQFMLYGNTSTGWMNIHNGTSWLNLLQSAGGTANYVSKFSDANTLVISLIQDDGTRVGIGTAPASPAFLKVNGNIQLSGATSRYLYFTDNTNVYAGYEAGAWIFNGVTGSPFFIRQNNVTKVFVDASGRLGVGAAIFSAASLLSVKGAVAIGDTYALVAAPTNGAIIEGSVGIGNSSPQRKLHVTGEVRITDLDTDTPTKIAMADNDGDMSGKVPGVGLALAADGTPYVDTTKIATPHDLTTNNGIISALPLGNVAINSSNYLQLGILGQRVQYSGEGIYATDELYISSQAAMYIEIDDALNIIADNEIVLQGNYITYRNNSVSAGSVFRMREGTTNGTNYVSVEAPDNLSSNTVFKYPSNSPDVGKVLIGTSSTATSWEYPTQSFFNDYDASISLTGVTGTPDTLDADSNVKSNDWLFNPTTNTYTYNGINGRYYSVSLSGQMEDVSASSEVLILEVYKNGTVTSAVAKANQQSGTLDPVSFHGQAILLLSIGDTINVKVSSTSGVGDDFDITNYSLIIKEI